MSATTEAPAANAAVSTPEKKRTDTRAKTEYVVLSKDDSGFWSEVAQVTANNANEAIRTVAEKDGAATYVAIPARSWQPTTVTVQTTTTLKLGSV